MCVREAFGDEPASSSCIEAERRVRCVHTAKVATAQQEHTDMEGHSVVGLAALCHVLTATATLSLPVQP